jgi:hypothetical protein
VPLSDVSCAWCGGRVEQSEQDPIAIGVVEQWRPDDEEPDWMVYGHRQCFISTLLPEVRVDFPPDWWPDA